MIGVGLLLHGAAAPLKREVERAPRPHQLTLPRWRELGEPSREASLAEPGVAGQASLDQAVLAARAAGIEVARARRGLDAARVPTSTGSPWASPSRWRGTPRMVRDRDSARGLVLRTGWCPSRRR